MAPKVVKRVEIQGVFKEPGLNSDALASKEFSISLGIAGTLY